MCTRVYGKRVRLIFIRLYPCGNSKHILITFFTVLFLHGSKASRPLLECFDQVKNKDEERLLRSRDKSRDRRTKEERKRWRDKDAVEKEEARTNGNGEAEERTMKRKNNC